VNPLNFVIYFLNERSFRLIRPLFIVWCRLKTFKAALKHSFGLEPFGSD